MNEQQTDFEWLQQFARAGSQQAFGDLVRRHIDLVFATALYKAGDAGGAEEISQNVFSALARKAWQFAPDDSLPAWLYKTALLESKSWLRGELRRRRREQTAAELGTTMKNPDEQPAFNALVPLLDEALLSLREKDRTALLLRFYEKQSLREVGGRLGVSEDTAHKRVQSALENLSQFFQRRGFRTATMAAAIAALQQTSATVSAATSALVAAAALKTAPPALAGLSGWLARLASLTKAQTAAVCVLVAAGPVLWQWHVQAQTVKAVAQIKASLARAQDEFDTLNTETEEYLEKSARLDRQLARSQASLAGRAAQDQKYADWKKQMRAQLLSADYQWSDDSPFIRISKKIAPQLRVALPVQPPGVIKPETRELLGLSPQETDQAESALKKYYASIQDLMQENVYSTNPGASSRVPDGALTSHAYALPPLGDGVQSYADDLENSLQSTLGDDRWEMVSNQLQFRGTDTLRRILDLDSGTEGQEMAVWVQQLNGKYMAGYGWNEPSCSFSSSRIPLIYFLPGAQIPPGDPMGVETDFRALPAALTGPALAWIQQQAVQRLGTTGGQ